MAENSNIEWTDHTFNPWIGCTKVHAGCAHCYAEADMDTRRGRVQWGPHGTRSKTAEANWRKPLKWNANAQGLGLRAKVFCASLADVFEDWQGPIVDHNGNTLHRDPNSGAYYADAACWIGQFVVTMDDLRRDLFALIDATPNLDWLLLTKRPENVRKMWKQPVNAHAYGSLEQIDRSRMLLNVYGKLHAHVADEAGARPNVWLGTSVSDQASAEKQIPELLKCRALAPVLFLSIEPLLGPICLVDGHPDYRLEQLDWVIVGGESGSAARPMHPQWVRDLRDQCTAAGVPFFFKQWGEWKPISEMPDAGDSLYRSNRKAQDGERQEVVDEVHGRTCKVETLSLQFDGEQGMRCDCVPGRQVPGYQLFRVGKKAAGRMLDGREWSEFPSTQELTANQRG